MWALKKFERQIKYFIPVFYGVGAAGMLFGFSRDLFIQLTPFALLLSAFVLIIFYQEKYNARTILVFVFIFLAGLFVEITGVNTGKIFGNYEYGKSLGVAIFETPLIIGLNWLLLVYTSASVIEKADLPIILKIFIGATLMLIYDLVLEQVAPKMDMWHWKNGYVALQNYLAWFALAFIFHTVIKIFRVKIRNPLAATVLVTQFLFFVILSIFLK